MWTGWNGCAIRNLAGFSIFSARIAASMEDVVDTTMISLPQTSVMMLYTRCLMFTSSETASKTMSQSLRAETSLVIVTRSIAARRLAAVANFWAIRSFQFCSMVFLQRDSPSSECPITTVEYPLPDVSVAWHAPIVPAP